MSLQMEKIDCHVHVGPYNLVLIRSTSFDDLAAMMQSANIKIVCISHTESVFHQGIGGNEKLFSTLPQYPQMRGYIYVDPYRPEQAISEIEKYVKHPQCVGIKCRTSYHGVPFNSPGCLQIFEVANHYRLTMLQHTDSIQMGREIAEVARRCTDMNFIIGHSGFGDWRTIANIMADIPNTYFDVCSSLADFDQVKGIAGIVGVDRMVLGTDMQLISPFWAIGKFEAAGFSEEDLHKIYWDNPKRVMKL